MVHYTNLFLIKIILWVRNSRIFISKIMIDLKSGDRSHNIGSIDHWIRLKDSKFQRVTIIELYSEWNIPGGHVSENEK